MSAARALAAAAACTALAGCGAGHGPSAAAYRAQASRICADAKRRTEALPRPGGLGDLRRYLSAALVIAQRDTAGLRALNPPGALRARHAAALRAQDAAVTRLRRLRDDIGAGTPSRALVQRGLDDVRRLGRLADARFRALGLPRCAE